MTTARAFTSGLTCPRCGLKVTTAHRSGVDEYCPRCIAQSAGALSVLLERRPSAGDSAPANRPRKLVARVAQGVRARARL